MAVLVFDGAEAGATSFTIQSPWAIDTTNPRTGTKFFQMATLGSAAMMASATKDDATPTVNATPGDHKLSCWFYWANSNPYFGMWVRGTLSGALTQNSITGYLFEPNYNGPVKLFKQVGAGQTLMQTVTPSPALASGGYHFAEVSVSGGNAGADVNINCSLKRPNGDWLKSDGTWTSGGAQVYCITTPVTSGSGNYIARVASSVYLQMGTNGTASTSNGVDDITWSDLAASGTAWTQALTESYNLSDVRISSIVRNMVETLTLVDNRATSQTHSLSESMLYTDAKMVSAGKSLTEAVQYNDARAAGLRRILSEVITYTDGISGQFNLARSFTETLSLTDIKTMQVAKSVTEILLLTDSRAMALKRYLTETYNLTDAEAGAVVVQSLLVYLSYTGGRA